MDIPSLHALLLYIQHSISFCGVLIIFSGVITALIRVLRPINVFMQPWKPHIDLLCSKTVPSDP